jgi:hypothetical protein
MLASRQRAKNVGSVALKEKKTFLAKEHFLEGRKRTHIGDKLRM